PLPLGANTPGRWQNTWGTAHFYLLPFVEQDNLYKSGAGGSNAYVSNVYLALVPPYLSSSDSSSTDGHLSPSNPWGCGNIAANYMVFGKGQQSLWDAGNSVARITSGGDGSSNTIFFSTRYCVCGYGGSLWAHGNWNWAYMPMFAYNSAAVPQ